MLKLFTINYKNKLLITFVYSSMTSSSKLNVLHSPTISTWWTLSIKQWNKIIIKHCLSIIYFQLTENLIKYLFLLNQILMGHLVSWCYLPFPTDDIFWLIYAFLSLFHKQLFISKNFNHHQNSRFHEKFSAPADYQELSFLISILYC